MAGNSIERDAWNNALARPSEWLVELTPPENAPQVTSRSETRITVTPPRDMLPQSGTGYYWPTPTSLHESPSAPPLFRGKMTVQAGGVSWVHPDDHARVVAECDALRADAERWREAQELRAERVTNDEAYHAGTGNDYRGPIHPEIDAEDALYDAAKVLLRHAPDAIPRAIAQATADHHAGVLHRAYAKRKRLTAALCAPETDAERAAREELKR